MNADLLLSCCGIPLSQSLNVYLTGSRVYGTAAPTSDWDVFLIVTDDYFAEMEKLYADKNETLPLASQWHQFDPLNAEYFIGYRCLVIPCNGEEANVNLYNCTSFRKKIQANDMQALYCVYLPEEFKWRHDLEEFKPENIIIHSKLLARSVMGESEKKMKMAKRKWQIDPTHKIAKKIIVHAFRCVMFGIQVVLHQKITNYKIANDLYYEIMADEIQEWSGIEQVYKPRFKQLRQEFSDILIKDRMMMVPEVETKHSFEVEKYMKKAENIDALKRFLSLEATNHDQYPNLVHLRGSEGSSNGSAVVQECGNGLLYDVDTSTVASVSIRKVLSVDDRHKSKFVYNKFGLYLRRSVNLSAIVTMYYYDNKWRIHSEYTPDASEQVHNGNGGASTLQEIFWKLFKGELPSQEDTNKCFVFVLDMYQHIRNVSKEEYELVDKYLLTSERQERVGIIAVIDKRNVIELDPPEYRQKYHYEPAKSDCAFCDVETLTGNKIDNLKSMSYAANALHTTQVWIQDTKLARVCFDTPQRLALLEVLRNPTSPDAEKLLLDVIRSVHHEGAVDQVEKVMQHYPSLLQLFNHVSNKYHRLCELMDKVFVQASASEDNSTVDQRVFIKRIREYPIEGLFDQETIGKSRETIVHQLSHMRRYPYLPNGLSYGEDAWDRVDRLFGFTLLEKGCYSPSMYENYKS